MSDTLEFKDLIVGRKILLVHAHSTRKEIAEIVRVDLEVQLPGVPSICVKGSLLDDTLVYTEGGRFPSAWRFLVPDPYTGDPDATCLLSNWWYLREAPEVVHS